MSSCQPRLLELLDISVDLTDDLPYSVDYVAGYLETLRSFTPHWTRLGEPAFDVTTFKALYSTQT